LFPFSSALPEVIDAVGAGKDDPMVGLQLIDGLIQFFHAKEDDLNGGKFDNLCPCF